MPASARLLQKLKETWGEEVTQDLVTWVNEGQTVNRADLREPADRYFARIGDRLDERIAVAEARWRSKLEERIGGVQRELDERINAVRLEVAGLRADVSLQMRDQMKRMFGFWIGPSCRSPR